MFLFLDLKIITIRVQKKLTSLTGSSMTGSTIVAGASWSTLIQWLLLVPVVFRIYWFSRHLFLAFPLQPTQTWITRLVNMLWSVTTSNNVELTLRCSLVELEAHGSLLFFFVVFERWSAAWIVGTASPFRTNRLEKDVPGKSTKGLSKHSGLKCFEQSREFAVGDHFAHFVHTKFTQSLHHFFSESSDSEGNLWRAMFLEASGTFEQPPATHLYGIFATSTA